MTSWIPSTASSQDGNKLFLTRTVLRPRGRSPLFPSMSNSMRLQPLRYGIQQLRSILKREERSARVELGTLAQQLSQSHAQSEGPVRKNSVAD